MAAVIRGTQGLTTFSLVSLFLSFKEFGLSSAWRMTWVTSESSRSVRPEPPSEVASLARDSPWVMMGREMTVSG